MSLIEWPSKGRGDFYTMEIRVLYFWMRVVAFGMRRRHDPTMSHAPSVAVDGQCISAIIDMKVRKATRYVRMSIADSTTLVVQKVGPRGCTFDQFTDTLSREEPCFTVFDYEYVQGNRRRTQEVLLVWIPDTAQVRAKMIYWAAAETLRAQIDSRIVEVRACHASEMRHEAVMQAVCGKG